MIISILGIAVLTEWPSATSLTTATYGAEHVFALLLAVSRHLVEAVERTRRGNLQQTGLRGFDLRGKTLGGIAKGFGMDVVATDIRPDEAAAQRMGFCYTQLDEVLTAADAVTLHVPATPQTIRSCNAVLINTARGNIVDVAALIGALAGGKLAAAGLHVLPEAPAIREETGIIWAEPVRETYSLKALRKDG